MISILASTSSEVKTGTGLEMFDIDSHSFKSFGFILNTLFSNNNWSLYLAPTSIVTVPFSEKE